MEGEEKRVYFACWYRLDAEEGYFVWYDDAVDGVVAAEPGTLAAFPSLNDLLAYTQARRIRVQAQEPARYDLDSVARWTASPTPATVDCETFLNAWNLFGDAAASLGADFSADKGAASGTIYYKLFFGCNLPALMPSGQRHTPEWSAAEVKRLARVLQAGLELFRKGLRSA